ncbi:hypothetical protein Plim_2853 [Planctopirus limnophila DSM 3776]|uniref:Uncharacterized protein n=1 Tax=Planctopirus limnophila (strain ATCC 43296 / DSM 3776 / IFAM 1008 / Mu 290) TaxID=521674 RepID=D5SRI2_PLAL2|nr:hypothetical protein Plim_2853 [Planctopirus limnophila DSM 3776]
MQRQRNAPTLPLSQPSRTSREISEFQFILSRSREVLQDDQPAVLTRTFVLFANFVVNSVSCLIK